jgi:hypothetical protein
VGLSSLKVRLVIELGFLWRRPMRELGRLV